MGQDAPMFELFVVQLAIKHDQPLPDEGRGMGRISRCVAQVVAISDFDRASLYDHFKNDSGRWVRDWQATRSPAPRCYFCEGSSIWSIDRTCMLSFLGSSLNPSWC